MGKVLSNFTNGWPGTPSRSVDEIILSMRNGSDGEIPFGSAVFFVAGQNACEPFDPDYASSYSMDNFIGITVRSGDKTPNLFGSNEPRGYRAAVCPRCGSGRDGLHPEG